jgi:hypothetical protein
VFLDLILCSLQGTLDISDQPPGGQQGGPSGCQIGSPNVPFEACPQAGPELKSGNTTGQSACGNGPKTASFVVLDLLAWFEHGPVGPTRGRFEHICAGTSMATMTRVINGGHWTGDFRTEPPRPASGPQHLQPKQPAHDGSTLMSTFRDSIAFLTLKQPQN